MSERKILIIGSLPKSAGVGGVTIHVERLLNYLVKEHFSKYFFVDYKQYSIASILCLIIKYDIVHFHFSNPYVRLFFTLWACLCGTKVITTYHGNYSKLSNVRKSILILTLKITSIPIVINEPSFNFCKRYNKRTKLLPAFIPPLVSEELDDNIINLISQIKTSGKLLVSTNASTLAYDKDGNEIYGIEFLIKLFGENKNMYLLISDPSGKNKAKYDGVYDNISFIDYPHNYIEILKRADICIRNTSTDGDSLSVKESLYIGCRTLCTDIVNRPQGCFLFKYNDASTLNKAIIISLNENNNVILVENGAEKIIALYDKLIK